jgi:lipoprotein-anchoring transpeptidase ErfK/SrfK
MSTEQPASNSKGQLARWALFVALAAVVIFGLIFARFAFFGGNGGAETSPKSAQIGQASPFATATASAGGSGSANSGTVVAGQTPNVTAAVPGYPAPNVVSNTTQQLLSQAPSVYGSGVSMSKVIVVSLQGQYLQAFQNGKLVLWTYVITGRGSLPTPPGWYQIFLKDSPLTFLPGSTDPKSPFFGYPSKVQYGMEFLDGGYYIHDTWWHSIYGPGLTFDHWDPGRLEWQEGSHGCVNTPLDAMAFLYQWADLNTPVIVTDN